MLNVKVTFKEYKYFENHSKICLSSFITLSTALIMVFPLLSVMTTLSMSSSSISTCLLTKNTAVTRYTTSITYKQVNIIIFWSECNFFGQKWSKLKEICGISNTSNNVKLYCNITIINRAVAVPYSILWRLSSVDLWLPKEDSQGEEQEREPRLKHK